MSQEAQLILIGYAAAATLALFVALSLRREYRPPYPYDWGAYDDPPWRDRGYGRGLLILVAAIAVFIVLALQP